MPYVPTQAPPNLRDHDDLRKWVEEEFRRLSQAYADTETRIIGANTAAIAALQALVPLTTLTNVLAADVVLNPAGTYFVGPTVAQGSVGTWFAVGNLTVMDTAGSTSFYAKLWDGTTVISSGYVTTGGASFGGHITMAGVIAAPVGNIRVSCVAVSGTGANSKMVANQTGAGRDSKVTVMRIA